MAGLAEATETIQIGPLVAATSFHSPAMIAKMASTVDEISGGRLILGLGAGWNETEYRAFGFAYDNRVSRFEEAFHVIRTLIREGAIDFEGDYYSIRDMELVPAARPEMKLMVGSNGPRMLRITAPHIDMWNTWHVWFGNRAQGLLPLFGELDRAADESGRNVDDIEKTAAVYVELSRGQGRQAGSESRPDAPAIAGTHEEIASALTEFKEVGIDHMQIVLDPIDAAGVTELAEIVALVR